jgi:nickel/cobalt transporter (NicO) family protein
MEPQSIILLGTAATVGFLHTLLGVDHSLPFVVLARTQRWTLRKTLGVTAACGLAHILSSVVIGTVGIALGVALERLEWFEAARGGLAARLLIGFGLAYMVWGIYRSIRTKHHSHIHAHADGTVHDHEHHHEAAHAHAHRSASVRTVTVMSLFVIFVLGPCEALIPMLIVPAHAASWALVAGVIAVFGVTTLATMLALVTVGYFGLRWRGFATLERHMHAAAGFAICASGLAIELFGI